MKKIIKYLFCLTLLFTLAGCANNNDDDKTNEANNSTNETTNNDDFDEIDTQIKNQFGNDYEVNRDDVIDAVNYINNTLDNVKDKEVAKKLYEKGSYLEMAANYGDVGEDDTIRNLGIKAKNYANKVYHASDDEVDNVISDAEGDFDEFTTKLGNGIDNAVDDFMNFFETKKTNE